MKKDNVPNSPLDEQSLVSDPQPARANLDWDQWKPVKSTQLWKAVALLCDIAQTRLESSDHRDKVNTFLNKTPKFSAILKRAENHVGTDLFKASFFNEDCPHDSEVELSVFTTWAKFAGYQQFPIGYPWLPKEMPHKNLDWPWGRHETDLLRHLAAAANRFWTLYDPADPSTAPTNKKVTDWLKEQGVAHRNAEVMATLLRPDELAPGPRK